MVTRSHGNDTLIGVLQSFKKFALQIKRGLNNGITNKLDDAVKTTNEVIYKDPINPMRN